MRFFAVFTVWELAGAAILRAADLPRSGAPTSLGCVVDAAAFHPLDEQGPARLLQPRSQRLPAEHPWPLVRPITGTLLAAGDALQVSAPGRASLAPRAAAVMQMNSDSRPTREYFDFLLGRSEQQVTEDGPSVIVGEGRIGSMLRDFGERMSRDDVIVRRGDVIPANHPGPVYVCTPTEDLPAVIAACPPEKRDDLVFLQDGMLEPIFQREGLYGPTQAALFLACVRRGGKPVDGVNSETPEGLTTISGKWAGAFAMRMGTGNLVCHEKMARDGRRACLERLVFVSAYNLVGAVHGGITVGEVASKHYEEVSALCRELASFIRYTLAVSLFTGLDERLAGFAKKVEFLPTKLEDFEYRNGYFYKYSKMAGERVNPAGIKVEVPDTTPLHTEYLLFARDQGLISQALLDSV